MDLNVVTITGRLADDPKPHATGNGRDVTMLRVAVSRPRRPGQQRSDADFVDVAAWDDLARLAAKYLAKGLRVGVTGRLQQRTWNTQEGLRSRLQVAAGQLHFIDFKEQSEHGPRETNGGAHVATAAEAAEASTQAAEPSSDTADAAAEVVVEVDGGSRGNPGPAGYGVVIATPAKPATGEEAFHSQVLDELATGIGWATNNVAEYRAVIAGLERARALGARRVWVRGDSKLVIQQLSGAYKVNSPALLSLHAEARRLAEGFDDVRFEHVIRQANQRADALANQAMNAQGSIADPAKATAAPPSVQSALGAGASSTTAPDHADAERN